MVGRTLENKIESVLFDYLSRNYDDVDFIGEVEAYASYDISQTIYEYIDIDKIKDCEVRYVDKTMFIKINGELTVSIPYDVDKVVL